MLASPVAKSHSKSPAEPFRHFGSHRPATRWEGIGNQATQRALRPPVGPRDSPLEREADHFASEAMSAPANAPLKRAACHSGCECASCQASAPGAVGDAVRGPGQALDAETRAFFEPRLGRDLGAVRIHADSRAARSAKALGARAYTHGNHVVFAAGRFSPGTPQGRELLAHELAHVAQQADQGFAAIQRDPDEDAASPPPDATIDTKVQGTVIVSIETIHREGLYSRLVTTMDQSTFPPTVTQRLYRRDDNLNPDWTDVTSQAAREGGISVEWNMPTLQSDEDIIRNIKGPGLLYGLFPFHVMPYLKDQTLPIRNPYLRMGASATQQTLRAVDKVNAELLKFALQTGAELGPAAVSLAGATRGLQAGASMVSRGAPAASTLGGEAGDLAEAAPAVSGPAPVGPRVVQLESDDLVIDSTFAMANRTGHTPVALEEGSLKGASEATMVGHGLVTDDVHGAVAVRVGGAEYTPKQFAGSLADAGWEGGTLRLAACKTGTSCIYNYTFGQELANELEKMGLDTVVIVPRGNVGTEAGKVNILGDVHGLPQVTDPGGALRPVGPLDAWDYLLGE
jgi:hypothetical protein